MNKLLIILLLLSYSTFSQTTLNDTIKLEENIVYGSLNASNTTPFSFSNINSLILEKNIGVETAYILSSTPSITFYSDNGSNLGYVYYRLRGIDQTRLNVTLNGVPLNEPEDQGSYFNNFPNFLSFIDNIQIIRGSGLSKVGTSTFGGSLNFNTKVSNKNSVEFSTSFGSYNTNINEIKINSKKFFIGLTNFKTNGFKYNSDNVSSSLNYGFDFKLFNQKVKLFGILGKQENGMAWVGETLEQINQNPRLNTNKIGERDNFLNSHNQISFENNLIKNNKITYSLYYQYQNGWYDTDVSLFDSSLEEGELISRIKLNFNWFGLIYNQLYTNKYFTLNFGLNYSNQNRNHSGLSNYQKSNFVEDYNNSGLKQELSQYIKLNFKILQFNLYGDIQNKYINYKYNSPNYNLVLYNNTNINYSIGLSYSKDNNIIHYGFGKTSREPRRSDLFGGLDNYLGNINTLKDELVYSQDLGYKYLNSNLEFSLNLYKMNFENEFMQTGEYGQNGITLYKNVCKSYRKGIELSSTYKFSKFITSLNLTLSDNKFFDKNIWFNSILSPNIVGNINITRNIGKFIYIGLNSRYNSKTTIDLLNLYNLPSYWTLDGFSGIKGKRLELMFNVNNITNSLILTNGSIGFDGSPRYFIMSNISSLFTIKIKI